MPIRINKRSFLHIDAPAGMPDLMDCRIAGTIGPNPYYGETDDEPRHIVTDIKVKTLDGRDITAAVEGWEFTRIYEELIEGYGDAQEEAAELRANERQESLMLYGR